MEIDFDPADERYSYPVRKCSQAKAYVLGESR